MARRNQTTVPSFNAMVASAAVMARRPEGLKRISGQDWQAEAWHYYDVVGELRFGINWLANALSRVNLVAATKAEHLGDEPSPLIEPDPENVDFVPTLSVAETMAIDLVGAIAGGPGGQGQLLAACATQLSVPGIGYILMTPDELGREQPANTDPLGFPVAEDLLPTPNETWKWKVLSQEELKVEADVYQVQLDSGSWVPLSDSAVLIKVWRPHARKGWEPDSPCRAVLGVLRQIVLMDEHVTATAQSRLAGAGIFVVPSEAEFAPAPGRPTPVQLPSPTPLMSEAEDDFVSVLVDTMTLPIGDRGSAAAVVPLVIRIPGEFCEKARHITFWTEFSGELATLREGAIKRLALGLDMPPEVLTGMSDVNHWTAWQVEETGITLHIEPLAETICHALTIGYLRPALQAAGIDPAEAEQVMVWYDVTDLTVRPDRSQDAIAAYDRYELSGSALRRESGLSDDDAPSDEEKRTRLLISMLGNPALAPQAVGELLDGQPGPPPGPPPADGGEATAPEDGVPVEVGSVVEACDGLVFRALERAGARLRSLAGRKLNGGAAAIQCDDPARLHLGLKATDYATLDQLLDGAWARVPVVARRLGLDPENMTQLLDNYTRALLATGHEHDPERLADALGLLSTC